MRTYNPHEYPVRIGISPAAIERISEPGGRKAKQVFPQTSAKSVVKLTTRKWPTNSN